MAIPTGSVDEIPHRCICSYASYDEGLDAQEVTLGQVQGKKAAI
jgi:hypothetical protein